MFGNNSGENAEAPTLEDALEVLGALEQTPNVERATSYIAAQLAENEEAEED